jgi:hypothetical protein
LKLTYIANTDQIQSVVRSQIMIPGLVS